ncbi:MAG: helix-turn-helix transcriptional regulator [Clostridium sp.]|nr:helix-turn-helix transcriptional regulator [Clostridium sp.]
MYEIFEKLLNDMGITAYRFCKDTGVSSSTISTWKKKNSICGTELAGIIANYFDVTIDYILTGQKKPETNSGHLTSKDERDIAKTVSELMSKLNSQDGAPLFFDGEEITPETKILFEQQLKSLVTTVKEINKVKFNPGKNKK